MVHFLADFRADFRGTTPFVAWVFLTVLFAAGGPLGTLQASSFEHRFLFWAVLIAGIMGLTNILSLPLERVLARALCRREIAMVAAVVTPLVFAPIESIAMPGGSWRTQDAGDLMTARPGETLVFLYLVSLVLGARRLVVNDPLLLSAHRVAPDPKPKPALATSAEMRDLPRIVARLSPDMQAELLVLTGRDHYVDVSTRAGTESILLRFADAMAEAAPTAGTQIHRSHWVAWAAIDRVERDGAKVFVRVGDALLPVSRSYRPRLRARGLL